MKRAANIIILAGIGLAGCATDRAAEAPPAAASPAASAEVRDVSGRSWARAGAVQLGDSIRVSIEAAGMAPGTYAAHVHTTGRCDAPDFTSAGPHWNPTGQQHGKDNPQGMHKGDLPNLLIGSERRGTLEYTIPSASVSGGASPLLDADGASVVIHAKPDDYRTDPAGNAGARVACGVLG
jgi:Cu-Zn family superoxide dismutase